MFVPHLGNQPSGGIAIGGIDTKTKLAIGKRAKQDAKNYLAEKGITIGKNSTYAVLQANGDDFFANPRSDMLSKDWQIILNNNQTMELIVLTVPNGQIVMETANTKGLVPRSDKPECINLHPHVDTFIDKTSGIDFSPYVINRLKY